MEPATNQDYCKETDSRDLGKTERIALVRAFLCCILLEQADLNSLVFFLDIDGILSGALRSGILCEIDSNLFVFSYQV